MSKYTYNKNFFEEIDNNIKAYWLGFLYADGCITRFYRNEKLRSMSLELTLQTRDKGLLFRFLKDLEANVPIQDRKHKIKDEIYYSNRVVINCTKMCRDLIKLGCTPDKSLTLSFPSEDILPKEFVSEFIRGYFDGDGCIHYSENKGYHKNPEWISKSFVASFVGTYDFLSSLKIIFNDMSININKLGHGNTGKAYELRITGKHNLHKLYNYLYNNADLFIKRKNDIFQYAFRKYKLPA